MLIDDEALELRELQSGTDRLMCSDHLATSGMLGCSLCKDVLDKFPPGTVKMKKPICLQPWDSSPEIVKKVFKVLPISNQGGNGKNSCSRAQLSSCLFLFSEICPSSSLPPSSVSSPLFLKLIIIFSSMKEEIVDETDEYVDVHKRIRVAAAAAASSVARAPSIRRLTGQKGAALLC